MYLHLNPSSDDTITLTIFNRQSSFGLDFNIKVTQLQCETSGLIYDKHKHGSDLPLLGKLIDLFEKTMEF